MGPTEGCPGALSAGAPSGDQGVIDRGANDIQHRASRCKE
jgi:hypothetical protein